MSEEQIVYYLKILGILSMNVYIFHTCMLIMIRFREQSLISRVQKRLKNKEQSIKVQQEHNWELPHMSWKVIGIAAAAIFCAIILMTLVYIMFLYSPNPGG